MFLAMERRGQTELLWTSVSEFISGRAPRLEVAARRSGGRAKRRFMGLEEEEEEDAVGGVRWSDAIEIVIVNTFPRNYHVITHFSSCPTNCNDLFFN